MTKKKRQKAPAEDKTPSLRKEFKQLMDNATYCSPLHEWQEQVADIAQKLFGDNPSPEQWVEAAKQATTECEACSGTGIYRWGTCVNGQMTKSGPCFRCESKGRLNQADYIRNRIYDNHRKVI
jgi:hypothetical protein